MSSDEGTTYDVVVVGGGPAGLQATLTLGRMHRRVLLLDAGPGRNGPTRHMHNFITHDGRTPEEFRELARADLTGYPHVEVRDVRAEEVARDGDGFVVRLADGGEARSRRLLLATGLRDQLPDVPGLEELWGTAVLPCPYCDGHEQSGKQVAILGEGPHAVRLALLMHRFTSDVTVLLGGGNLRDEDVETLDRADIPVVPERVLEVAQNVGRVRLTLEDADAHEADMVVLAAPATQAAPLGGQLDLEVLEGDCCISVDQVGRTSLEGVYAAGDMARCGKAPMMEASVLAAAASGQLTATVCDLDLLADETGVARVPSR